MNEEKEKMIEEPRSNPGVFISDDYTSAIDVITDEKLTKIVPYKRESMIDTRSFFDVVSRGALGIKCPDILPKNCRYFSTDPHSGNTLLVLEFPPAVRTISINLDLGFDYEKLRQEGKLEAYGYEKLKIDSRSHRLRLSFPYIILVIRLLRDLRYKNCKVFYRTTPLNSLYDFLLKSNLLNVNENEHMCIRGSEDTLVLKSLGDIIRPESNLNTRVNQVLDRIWNNRFNNDYHFAFSRYQKFEHIGNLLEWEYFSKVDPLFIFKVPWIKHDKSLIQEVQGDDLRIDSNFSYVQWLNTIIHGNHSEKCYINRTMSEAIYLNPSDESDANTLSVGDIITLDGKKYYIHSFKTLDGSNDPDFVDLEDEERNITTHNLTPTFKSRIIRTLKKEPILEVTTKNGKVIKQGDIVLFRPAGFERLLSVDSVRKSRDGFTEVRSGDSTYLVDFIDFDVIDKNNLVINGIKFEKGVDYIVKTSDDLMQGKVFGGYICSFDGFINDKLLFGYKNSRGIGKSIKVDILRDVSQTVRRFDGTFSPVSSARVGNKVYISTPSNQIFISQNKEILVTGDFTCLTYDRPNWQEYLSKILIDNTRFYLPSFDVDIDLRVGDNVIISNWSSPQDLLKIRTIIGFRVDNRIVYTDTRVGEDQTTDSSFPILDLNYGTTTAGCIRKATYVVNDLTIGMEVIPKVRIPGFLKSKPCRISAFIIDSDIPLVLCSNFHTFWMTETNVRLFNFKTSPSELSGSQFMPKLKPQLGDVFSFPSYVHDVFKLLTYTIYLGRKFVKRLKYESANCKWMRTNTITPSFVKNGHSYYYYGIPAQRIKEEIELVPNLFSWFIGKEPTRDLL